jgi:cobalt/nickel transport system permease protein
MIREPFAMGDSLIHRLDPRIRVVIATIYSFLVAISGDLAVLSLFLAVSVFLVGLARLRVWEVAKRMAVVNGLVLFLWVVLPLTFEGEALFTMGPLAVTRPGVDLAVRITLKSNTILLALITLAASIRMATLGHALNRLHVPDRIVHLLLLTYRYIFVLEGEYRRLRRAARIRGFQPQNNMHTYKTFAYLVGMLLVRAVARADRVHQAMLCRGFAGKFHSLQEFSFSKIDWIWSAFMVGTMVGLGILEWTRIG